MKQLANPCKAILWRLDEIIVDPHDDKDRLREAYTIARKHQSQRICYFVYILLDEFFLLDVPVAKLTKQTWVRLLYKYISIASASTTKEGSVIEFNLQISANELGNYIKTIAALLNFFRIYRKDPEYLTVINERLSDYIEPFKDLYTRDIKTIFADFCVSPNLRDILWIYVYHCDKLFLNHDDSIDRIGCKSYCFIQLANAALL